MLLINYLEFDQIQDNWWYQKNLNFLMQYITIMICILIYIILKHMAIPMPYIKIIYALLAYSFWIMSQTILGSDIVPECGIVDRLHHFVQPVNSYLHQNLDVTSYGFILSSALIDINMAYLIINYLTTDRSKSFMLLCLGFTLRQISQWLSRLPQPAGTIWFDPGFPSVMVTYGVETDFFFSGHTLVSLVTGCDIIDNGGMFGKIYGILFICYEISFIILTHSHYYMDVYAAITSYFTIRYLYERYVN